MQRLCLTIFLIWIGVLAVHGQGPSVARPSASIALSIALKEHIRVGEIPWVHLIVKNMTNEDIFFPADQVHVEGEKGEPPMTLRQRQLTHRLLPGEQDLMGGGFEPTIEPGTSRHRKYDLSLLYDLSKPGKYTVFIDVLDESASKNNAGVWLRSPIATFEVQAPTR